MPPQGKETEERPTVICNIDKKPVVIEVRPDWGPIGAQRFLDLVEDKYLDESALYRPVKNFLVQFGLAKNDTKREKWRKIGQIEDDPMRPDIPFVEGILSFAGGGTKKTRQTEMFITLGKTVPSLGRDALHEVPFGKVIKGMDVVQSIYFGYGDIEPFGKGPSQGKIWEQGYKYLEKDFPKLSHIDFCRIQTTTAPEKEIETIARDEEKEFRRRLKMTAKQRKQMRERKRERRKIQKSQRGVHAVGSGTDATESVFMNTLEVKKERKKDNKEKTKRTGAGVGHEKQRNLKSGSGRPKPVKSIFDSFREQEDSAESLEIETQSDIVSSYFLPTMFLLVVALFLVVLRACFKKGKGRTD